MCWLVVLPWLLLGCKADVSVQPQPTDAVVQEFPLAFVERPLDITRDDDTEPFATDEFMPQQFNAGARLMIKQNAFAQSAETDITSSLFAADAKYDVKDLAVSPDGMQLVFALRAPEIANADEDEQPKWALYRYDVKSKTVSPIIADANIRAEGHDIQPAFLPDGRILFSSTRQRQARQILLDEFKPQYTALDEDRESPTFNIHVMDADGRNIQQLSFNLSHDLYPTVLADGHILFSRWDNQSDRSMINLYQMRPDGSQLQLVYGWHSHLTGKDNSRVEFVRPHVLANDQVAVLLRRETQLYYNSWPQQLALDSASDVLQPLHEKSLPSSGAQQPVLPWPFHNGTRPDKAGAVHSYFALHDGSGRFLVSWSPCRYQTPQGVVTCAQLSSATDETPLAPPLYGLWLFDSVKQTQQPVRLGQEGRMVMEPVVLQKRNKTVFLAGDPAINRNLAAEGAAIVDIRNVYDIDGTLALDLAKQMDPAQTPASNRSVHYIRFYRGVPMPPEDVVDIPNFAFGVSARQLMRELVGFAPVEPDGSVRVKVPANVPLSISLLNSAGQSVSPQHQQWFSVRPGETLQCQGCHTPTSTKPHGRLSGMAPPAYAGAAADGAYVNANTAYPAIKGETMAQTLARLRGDKPLSADLHYDDLWPASTPSAPVTISYRDLTTTAPEGLGCFSQWQAICRLRIDYPTHIQPLWQLERVQVNAITGEQQVRTCVSCHNRSDANGNAQVPAGQLELTDQASDLQARHMTSYRELVSTDNSQQLQAGILVDLQVPALDANGNPRFVRDANGELVLDANGQPQPILVAVPVAPSLRIGNARGSAFFRHFAAGGSHAGDLSAAELRLIADWLDLGGQYYNSPFVIPAP